MGKEKYNKEELIRLLIHEGKSYKEVAAMRGDGSTGEAIRKAANRYGIKVSDRKKLRKCEYCGKEHDGSFGSGRFCCSDCAKKYSLSFSKGKKPEDKSTKEEKVEESVKIAPPKECTTELSRFDGKFIKRLREWSNKRSSFDIYLGSEKVAELNLIEKSKEELNIMWIETYEDYRGKGYSQAILTELIRFAKSQGYKYVTLEVPGRSPDARHIYEKLGFKDDGVLTTPEEDFYWGGLTRMKLKLFANITNVTSLTPLKNIITTTTRKATGLSNSKIATQAKNAALDLHSVTKDAQNSFISPNGNGYVTKSYFTKRRPKGKKVEFVGDLFGNPNQLQKPKVINSSSNKGGNSSISSLDAKRMNLKRYNSHKTRSLEVTPTAPGQNEWVKRVKTNGQARWENNGLYIPGFEKL